MARHWGLNGECLAAWRCAPSVRLPSAAARFESEWGPQKEGERRGSTQNSLSTPPPSSDPGRNPGAVSHPRAQEPKNTGLSCRPPASLFTESHQQLIKGPLSPKEKKRVGEREGEKERKGERERETEGGGQKKHI